MKKTLLIASALLMFSITSRGQETKGKEKAKNTVSNEQKPHGKSEAKRKTPEERAKANTEHLNEVAGLTEEQKVKVNAFALTKAQKMDAIREKYKGQPEQKEAAKKEKDIVKKEFRESIKSVLTPEQLEKVKQKAREHKKEGYPSKPNKLKPQEELEQNKILDGKE